MLRLLLQAVAVATLVAGPVAAAPPESANGKDPLGVLLAEGRAACAQFRDYSCTFTRQERVNGALMAEQVATMKVRSQPFSVALRFARPDAIAGQEIIYIDRKRMDGKMRFRPAGVPGVAGFQFVAVNDKKVLATSRHPVSKLGVAAILDALTLAAARERSLGNPVEVFKADYAFAGRPVTRYEVVTPIPHALREFYSAVVFVDKETRLPVRYEAYDQPRTGGSAGGELLEAHSYSDFKTNVGLGDSAFPY